MKLKNSFIITWWAILLITFFSLILFRLDYILSNAVLPFDYLAIILFFILAFLPFSSEISMFGVSVKKELEKVEESVEGLKEVIKNNNSNNNNIYLSPQLNDLQQEQLRESLHVDEEENSVMLSKYLEENKDIAEIFIIRFLIEKEIRRIGVIHLTDPNSKSLVKLIHVLDNHGIFDVKLANALIEVYFITSNGIHSEVISEKQKEFVLDVGPTLIERLKLIE